MRSWPFKRSKDLADLYALLENFAELWKIRGGVRAKTKFVDKKLAKRFRENLERFRVDGSIASAASMLKVGQEKILAIFEKL